MTLEARTSAPPSHQVAAITQWWKRPAVEWPALLRGFTTAHYLTLVAAFLLLLYIDRRQWFFFDEWEFLATRGLGGQSLRLFFPHNEHWSTIPILIFHALYAVVGLRTYIPYIVVLLLLHLGTGYLLWRAMLRSGGDGWMATALAAVFLLLGAGYENLIWAFQITFITSTLCGVGMLVLADHGKERFGVRDAAVWVVAIVGLMSSGVGITMVAVAGVVALLRRGWRAALVTLSVPAAVYIVWLAAIGHNGFYATTVTKGTILLIPDFVWKGLTATVDGATGLVGFGAVGIVGLLCWLLYHHRDATRLAIPFAGAIGAVVFFVLTGLGRASYGIDQGTAAHYIYVATALLLPITAVIASTVARRALVVQMALLALFVFVIGHNLHELASQANFYAGVKQQSKQQILAGAQLIASRAPLIGSQPDPRFAPDLTTGDLAQMLREGALPNPTGLTQTNYLDAQLALQVDIATTPEVPMSGAVTVAAGGGGFLQRLSNGCVQATTYGANHYLVLRFTSPGSVRLSSPATEVVQATLQMPPQGGQSDARNLSFTAGSPVYLSGAVGGDQVTLYLPPNAMQICGGSPVSATAG